MIAVSWWEAVVSDSDTLRYGVGVVDQMSPIPDQGSTE